MPARKIPGSLTDLSLRSIGGIILSQAYALVENKKKLESSGYNEYKANLIRDLQTHLFKETAHFFHAQIIKEILIALSDVLYEGNQVGPEGGIEAQRIAHELKNEQLDLICILEHPLVKEINISKEFMGTRRRRLHWRVVCKMSTKLGNMSNLDVLNLGQWNCGQFSLLAEHNQEEGEFLRFLPNLTQITASNVSNNFFQSVGKYCPNLTLLKVHSSDVSDHVLSWLSKCKKLQYVELYDNQNVSPVGFAQLLRSNPELKSLGRCECFGSVLTTVFDDNSIYKRSVTNVPEFLSLVEVDSSERMSTKELMFLVENCPKVKKLRIKYYPDDFRFDRSEIESPYLSALIGLDQLKEIRLIGANFYSHLFFQFIYIQGWQLNRMELTSIDEMNVNALKTIGEHCLNLENLHFRCCHFQLSSEDIRVMDSLTSPEKLCTERYFNKLKSLGFLLLSPGHLCIAKFCLVHALNLMKLVFDQYRNDIEEQLIQTIFEWNPLASLEHFEMGSGTGKLTVHSANLIIQNCPNLRYIGRLGRWGKVTVDQILGIQSEAQSRNYDLVIDHEDAFT